MKKKIRESESNQIVRFNRYGSSLRDEFEDLVHEFKQEELKNPSEEATDAFAGKWIAKEPYIEVVTSFNPNKKRCTKNEIMDFLLNVYGIDTEEAEEVFNKFFEIGDPPVKRTWLDKIDSDRSTLIRNSQKLVVDTLRELVKNYEGVELETSEDGVLLRYKGIYLSDWWLEDLGTNSAYGKGGMLRFKNGLNGRTSNKGWSRNYSTCKPNDIENGLVIVDLCIQTILKYIHLWETKRRSYDFKEEIDRVISENGAVLV